VKIAQKLTYLQKHHFGEWLKVRQEVENEISDQQALFCICGRLATGLHEMNCSKFRNKVSSETVNRLKHLLTTKKEK